MGKKKKLWKKLRYKAESVLSQGWDKKTENVEHVCFFVSYMRSGHTLLSSLLNAHKNVVVSNELGAGALARLGFSEREIFRLILNKDRSFQSSGRKWTGYDYEVEEGYEGFYDEIKMIGDKHGPNFIYNYKINDNLRDFISCSSSNIVILHHLRNPYDMISTGITRKRKDISRKDVINHVLSELERSNGVIDDLKSVDNVILCRTYYKNLVLDTENTLKNIFNTLDIDINNEYVDSCEDHVFESPSVTRGGTEWGNKEIEKVERVCKDLVFLRRYSGSYKKTDN